MVEISFWIWTCWPLLRCKMKLLVAEWKLSVNENTTFKVSPSHVSSHDFMCCCQSSSLISYHFTIIYSGIFCPSVMHFIAKKIRWFRHVFLCRNIKYFSHITLQDIVIETMLGRKNSVQGPRLLKSLFIGFKTISPSVTAKHPAHWNIHCVLFKVSIMCCYHFSLR